MADRYLLESSSTDGYQLEDASGVLLLEFPVDDTADGWWPGLQNTVVALVASTAFASALLAGELTRGDRNEDLVAPTTAAASDPAYTPIIQAPRDVLTVPWRWADEALPSVAAPTVLDEPGFVPGLPIEAGLSLARSQPDEDLPVRLEETGVAAVPVVVSGASAQPSPWGADEELPVANITAEDGGLPPWPWPAASSAIAAPAWPTEEVAPVVAVTIVDEDGQAPLAFVVPSTIPTARWDADELLPVANIVGDESGPAPMAPAASLPVAAPFTWGADETLPIAAAVTIVDEDGWIGGPPSRAVAAALPSWPSEELPARLEEDGQPLTIIAAVAIPRLPTWWGEEVLPAGQSALEEDGWFASPTSLPSAPPVARLILVGPMWGDETAGLLVTIEMGFLAPMLTPVTIRRLDSTPTIAALLSTPIITPLRPTD